MGGKVITVHDATHVTVFCPGYHGPRSYFIDRGATVTLNGEPAKLTSSVKSGKTTTEAPTIKPGDLIEVSGQPATSVKITRA